MFTRRDDKRARSSKPSPDMPPIEQPVVRDAKVRRRVRKALAQTITGQEARPARITTAARGGNYTAPPGVVPAAAGKRQAADPARAAREHVIVSLPRRQHSQYAAAQPAAAPMRASGVAKVSSGLFVRRLGVWLGVGARFAAHILSDMLRRRSSLAQRAARLRQAAERAGGSVTRIGRHAALRLDVLPIRYCQQLALMHDRMPPFATGDAIAIIERQTHQKLNEIFSTFDPVAIESSSVRCVYQAILRGSGEKVAVKVRRPGIGAVFEADLKVLLLIANLAEALALIHPGYAVGVCKELQRTLRAELDFRRGARYEELFGRRARKAKLRFYSTPRICEELSAEEVVVQEFESGMWLGEVLAAIERQDPDGLAYMRALNIEPRRLARRLLFINHWALYEHLTFHADPQPNNIVVRANSALVYVDSAVNGYLTQPRRQLFLRFHACQAQSDIWGMAQATLALCEPLPARDLNALAKEIEAAYYEQTLALKSKHATWHERSGAAMWLAAFKVMRRYRIHAPTDVLLYVRATLYHDSLAARLWPAIDYTREFKRYRRNALKRRGALGAKQARRRLRAGLPSAADFSAWQAVSTTANDLIFRLQRILAVPHDFQVVPLSIEKGAFVLITAIRFLVQCAVLALAGVMLVSGANAVTNGELAPGDSWLTVIKSAPYLAAVGLLALLHTRNIWFRLGDRRQDG